MMVHGQILNGARAAWEAAHPVCFLVRLQGIEKKPMGLARGEAHSPHEEPRKYYNRG
jgi:hypothetical protein